MRILVIGGGAREDALSWRLAQSPSCEAHLRRARQRRHGVARRELEHRDHRRERCSPTSRTPNGIDLVVIGPEIAIAAGVGDRLREPASRCSARTVPAGGSNRARSSPSASWSATASRPRARPSCIRSRAPAKRWTSGTAAASSSKPTDWPPAKASSCAKDVAEAARRARRVVRRTIAFPAAAPTCCSKRG